MIYARIEADGSITLIDLDPTLVAKWVADGNPKALVHRAYVVDPQPTPGATQKVVGAGYVVEPTQVRQTWSLADKSAAELEADALKTERADLDTYLASLQAQLDISNATRATLSNAQRINELENDTRASMRALKFLLRDARRRL